MTDGRGMLSFQRLDVYRCAIELLSFTSTLESPRGLSSPRGPAAAGRPVGSVKRGRGGWAMLTKLCR